MNISDFSLPDLTNQQQIYAWQIRELSEQGLRYCRYGNHAVDEKEFSDTGAYCYRCTNTRYLANKAAK